MHAVKAHGLVIASGMHAPYSSSVCASCLQTTHDERKANYADKQVGMKLEATMQLQDDSGMVDYNLALIIFRTGGQLDGHYFVAAPTPASAWVVFDDKNVLMPMSLRDLQGNYGKAVHGVMYVRKTAPAEDDWARLIPTACLGTDAPRQVSPPLP